MFLEEVDLSVLMSNTRRLSIDVLERLFGYVEGLSYDSLPLLMLVPIPELLVPPPSSRHTRTYYMSLL